MGAIDTRVQANGFEPAAKKPCILARCQMAVPSAPASEEESIRHAARSFEIGIDLFGEFKFNRRASFPLPHDGTVWGHRLYPALARRLHGKQQNRLRNAWAAWPRLRSGSAMVASRIPGFADQYPLRFRRRLISPYIRASRLHEFNPDVMIRPSFEAAPGIYFDIFGACPASNAARVDAGFKIQLSPNFQAFSNLNGEFSGRTESYAATRGRVLRRFAKL